MQCLVIGYGSVGKKHTRILSELDCSVAIVTSQVIDLYPCYHAIQDALQQAKYDYVIIANATYLHYQTLIQLIQCDYRGIVLVEKPLYSEMNDLPAHCFKKLIVGYNLRFHSLLEEAKKIIAQEKILSFSAYVGQYLPTWRKDVDYRDGYSAKKEQGGGVLRDLSHELDYCLWFCGNPLDVTATGGKVSALEISSEDVYSILMRCEFSPMVNLQLNYLDRCVRREMIIHTESKTLVVDLVEGKLRANGDVIKEVKDGVWDSYIAQHKAVLHNHFDVFCDYQSGLNVIKLIHRLEKANATRTWVTS